MDKNKWSVRFIEMAELVASWSKDPSSGVGAVITRGNIIISLGFNGFAKGVKDTPERLENRDIKYKLVIHAEENAILHTQQDLSDCTIYCTHPPCAGCASKIIQKKIKKVVFKKPTKDYLSRWGESHELSMTILKEAEIIVMEV